MPTAGPPMTNRFFLIPRMRRSVALSMRMNQTTHTVREQNIDLLWFDERGYFAFTECRMHHGLSPAIGSRLIIGRAYLGCAGARRAALIGNARSADRTTDTRNSSLFADRSHDMPALFAALDAHLLDS